MFVDLIKHKHGIGLFKQAITTWMFRSHVTNVSKQSYTYISCDDECNMMLMLMIWNANAMLNTRGVTVIMHHVELNTYSSFSRLNSRFTRPQTCHMLPLDHFKHTSNSGTIQASNSFDFHKWASDMMGLTRCTKQVLSNGWMTYQSTLPCFARKRGMPYNGGASTHIWEVKYVQFIP
jgi:hypothetical protein